MSKVFGITDIDNQQEQLLEVLDNFQSEFEQLIADNKSQVTTIEATETLLSEILLKLKETVDKTYFQRVQ